MVGKWRNAPEPIGNALQSILNQLDSGGHFEIIRLARVWPEVVGETIARRTEVSSLKFHTAVIKVSSAMWIQELNLMKPEILSRLTKELANDSVRDIRFVQGRLSRREHRLRLHVVPRQIRRAIELPELSDSELRRAFESLIEAWGRSSR
jgi:predicted nucleic acid-binding Zn ribbon protein